MSHDWHKAFFQGAALDIWLNALNPADTVSEVYFLAAELGLAPGACILDAPCGNGRHMLEFARRGYTAAGVDISEDLLREAIGSAGEYKDRLEFRQADLREIDWPGRFDGSYCFGNCFGYYGRAGMRTYLGAVTRALKPGARFVVDTAMSAESVLPRLENHLWWEVGDLHVLIDNTYYPEENRLETEHRFFRRGSAEVETRTSQHWIYTLGEIISLLETAGFKVLETYASREREPFSLGAPYLILTAEKN